MFYITWRRPCQKVFRSYALKILLARRIPDRYLNGYVSLPTQRTGTDGKTLWTL